MPLHLHPYYRERYGYERGLFPVAEAAFDELVSLPIFPHRNARCDAGHAGGAEPLARSLFAPLGI